MSQDQLKTPAADEPITLAGACQLFPRAKLTVSTLRAEAARGRLEIFRLGRRDYTTPAAMERMVQLDVAKAAASLSRHHPRAMSPCTRAAYLVEIIC